MAVGKTGAWLALMLALGLPGAAEAKTPVAGDLAWLRALAERGDGEAWYRIAVIKERGLDGMRDPTGAFAAYEMGAEIGNAESQVRLAQLLADAGELEAARKWFAAAAAQEVAAAAYNLALFEETGSGGPQDLAAAEVHYRQAAADGLPAAALQLALLYRSGRLGEADSIAALAWIQRAEALGAEEAVALASEWSAEASEAERAAAQRLSEGF